MKLLDLFEARFQEIVHDNPSVGTLKALARANRYHSARFVIYKDGTVKAADSEHFTHHSLAPAMEAWAIRGYVTYVGDGEYLYRSMEVYSPKNMDHPIFRVWERAGIGNGNPEVVEEDVEPPLPTRVYHVSRKRNRGSIKKLGLQPKIKEFNNIMRKPGVFCLETLDQARDWAYYYAMDEREPMDIFEVSVRDPGDLHPDPARDMQQHYDSWVIYKPVPPGELKLVATQNVPEGWTGPGINPQKVRNLEETPLEEKWTKKYKKSINCNAPKGFSQRAHCAARRKRRAGGTTTSKSVSENRLDALVESMLSHLETQGLTEAQAVAHIDERLDEDLRKWFKQKWVRFGPDGKIRGACARDKDSEGKPKCLPQKKAWALGKKRRATAARRKRKEDPNPERKGRAKNVATKEGQNFAPKMLAETAEESQDINTLAKFITSNILNKREFDYTLVYKLVPADKWPKVKSPIIQQMLRVLRIKNIKDPTRTAIGTIGRDDDGSLWMYIAPGRDPIATASTITHELTHALDLIKSQGKAFKSRSHVDKPDSSMWTANDWKNYLGNPMEINARFAQVLMFISDDVIENLHNDPNWSLSRDHLINWITRLFEFYKIDRSWFAEGPKGQKSYNRLLSRTMQFYQQLLKVARQDAVQKPGLLKKISTAVGSRVAKLISTFGLGKKGELDEDVSIDDVSCPSCGGPIVAEGELLERKDACYYKVKSRYKVWPSAYASGALVQCRKKGAANWGNKGKKQ